MSLLGAVALRAAETLPPSIRVVMDNNYPPFVMQAEGGLQGILVDQWRLWEIKTGIKVELSGMDWGEALRRMRAGEFDVIDTAFQTAERAEYLAFSKPYQKIDVPIFFSREIAGITDAKSLRGFPVGVKSGDADIDFLRMSGVETLLEFGSYEAVLQAARDHKISVFVVDLPPALYYLHKFGLQGEFRHSASLLVGEFRRGVAKGNNALLKEVEDGFARISPADYKAIEDKWYGAESFGQRSLRWLMPVAVGFCGVMLFLFLWNRLLQRTVRQRTAELKASQELFESIYHSVNDAIFVHDLETGAVVDVNERMCAMYGCSRDEAMRGSLRQLSQGDSPYGEAEALAWLRRAAAGQPQTFAWHCRRKDGSLFWGEVSMRRAKIGSVERIVVTVRDRTEKQVEEQDLREQLATKQWLEAIADATPGVLYVMQRAPDGMLSFLFASPSIEAVAGMSQEVLLKDGTAFFRIVHPDDSARVLDSIAESARTLQEWTQSYRVLHPRRGLIWVENHATLRRESEGGTLWHGFAYDITDRVNAEAKLKKTNAVLQIRTACDKALVRADDEQTLLHSVCTTAVEAGGYRMAWIGMVENHGSGSLRPVAVAGVEDGYLNAVRSTWSATERGQGPSGIAVRTGKPVVAQNIATNPVVGLWIGEALKRGYAAMLAIPISCDGKVIGALMINSSRPEDFAPDEVSVFAELVTNLGVRLDAIRAKELRLRAETELRAREQELRKSQDQLTATLDALPDSLFEVDRAGRICDFRAPNARALFMHPESFTGRTLAEVLPADVAAVIDVGLAEAAEKGRHFGGTYSLPMPDGLRWHELSIAQKTKTGAEEQRYVILVRDVTTRTLAEEALRESERYNRTLFDQTPIGLLLCRMDGGFVDINPACARIIGRAVEDALRLTYWDLTPARYAEQEKQQLERLRTTGRYGPYEKHYIHKDGHLVPVRLNGLIIQQHGEDFIWSSVEDITERIQTEAARRLSADRLQQAVMVSQIGIFDHYHVANSIYCSPILRNIYGLGSDDATSINNFLDHVHPDDRGRVEQAVRRSLLPEEDGLLDVESRIVRTDGSVRQVTTRAQTEFAGTGDERHPVRTVGAVVDITDRKLAEQALAASTSQVQHVLGAANCLLWQSRLTRTEVGEFDWQIYIPRSSLYRKLFGKDPDTPSLLPWKELGVPELPAMHQNCHAALVSGAPGYEQEFHAVVDGQTIWLREQVSIKKARWSGCSSA
jgi:PAS domain S-box-containing protein